MIPEATGRYCNSCKKSVIDFTAKSDEEIQQFFTENFHQPVCGRFKNTQIHRVVIDLPKNIFSTKMPTWMRFLVACLIIFGISIFPFETTVAGKPATEISFYQDEPVSIKTSKNPRILKKKKRRKYRITFDNRMVLSIPVGDIVYGFTVTTRDRPLVDIQCNPSLIPETQISLNNKPIPQKEKPRSTPFTPTEFILPSLLVFRKENTDPAMD